MTQPSKWYVPWDDALIRKYDINAPRYTSYPTAVQFTGLQAIEVQSHLDSQRSNQSPLSLYVHIPFCQHVCFYCGCNKIATKDRTRPDSYIDMLEREMVLHARNFGHRPITQLHLGGGTPTFLSLKQMSRLLDLLGIYFDWDPEVHAGEFSIELDPRETSDEMLCLLKRRGFNRISFGVQDFDEQTQIAINRVQPFELVQQKVDKARALGFKSISFDLICGLPHQSSESFARTWAQTLQLSPDRISLYNYAHLPERFKPQRRIDPASVPTADEKLAIMRDSIALLQQSGYVYIGMDHFAKPGDELTRALEQGSLQRNFQGYSTHAEVDMLALGVSGISQIDGVYLQNHREIEPYESFLDNMQLAIKRGIFLNEDDKIRQWAILQLACQGRLSFTELSQRFGINAGEYFADEWQRLQTLVADNLVKLAGDEVHVQPLGRLLLRPVLLTFDAYFNAEVAKRFSKVL
ncbi:oxygen-independent coproporphyrinogen III oxidase [Reinekea marinisedimentorum]|uniref:Coproporphyrinogen-III oxidase n=1 Tax=Reinekea marinisedimentorum TaxID=230495 RepID=A0A4R3I8U1_9GAMM|nr:oxygen-independent coproporphyrinogen III oxidase [Reinekea marinisedimentorum]TCS41751.1 oxygen-independent coproporphyrinogen-3 oxidase [Reinekea marinisedimentorum]